jgi:membrane protein implicated in regulation of membrane protease activity
VRWIALWLLLTGAHVAGWALARQVAGRSLMPGAETLVHFAAVPPVQLLALWVVATIRQTNRDQRRDQRAGTPDR